MNIDHEISDDEAVEHLRMCHESHLATTKNLTDVRWFMDKCTTRDLMKVRKRPTLEQMAIKLLKIQVRVKRTKKLWQIMQVSDKHHTLFSYMVEPNGCMNVAVFEVSRYYWARPKFLQYCCHCDEVSSARCWYMPLCGRCKLFRFCSTQCLRAAWDEHQNQCNGNKKFDLNTHSLMLCMKGCLEDYMKRPEHVRPKTPFFEVSCYGSYGERFQFRPIKFTRKVKDMLPPDVKWKQVMTTPYQLIILFVLKSAFEDDAGSGYNTQPIVLHLDGNDVKEIPGILTKGMVSQGIQP